MNDVNENIWWRLKDAWSRIIKILPYIFIPYVGTVFLAISMAEDIGIAIKLKELKSITPDAEEFKDVFRNYLISILAPIISQLYWVKAINSIMKFLGAHGVEEKDILYIEKKGKIVGYLGIIGQIIIFSMVIILFPLFFIVRRPLSYRSIFSPAMFSIQNPMTFLIIYIIVLVAITFTIAIIITVLQLKILKRLVFCINLSELDKKQSN
ncbi:MAG: hypothetical protein ACFFDN_13335 [Candidatus Hodarchaeota archaeon]